MVVHNWRRDVLFALSAAALIAVVVLAVSALGQSQANAADGETTLSKMFSLLSQPGVTATVQTTQAVVGDTIFTISQEASADAYTLTRVNEDHFCMAKQDNIAHMLCIPYTNVASFSFDANEVWK
jgi:hypothetical protein